MIFFTRSLLYNGILSPDPIPISNTFPLAKGTIFVLCIINGFVPHAKDINRGCINLDHNILQPKHSNQFG